MKLQRLEIFDKQMDRRDFLRHVGIGMMAILGGNIIIQALLHMHKRPESRAGYGSLPYGGKR